MIHCSDAFYFCPENYVPIKINRQFQSCWIIGHFGLTKTTHENAVFQPVVKAIGWLVWKPVQPENFVNSQLVPLLNATLPMHKPRILPRLWQFRRLSDVTIHKNKKFLQLAIWSYEATRPWQVQTRECLSFSCCEVFSVPRKSCLYVEDCLQYRA